MGAADGKKKEVLTKNARRRAKAKLAKQQRATTEEAPAPAADPAASSTDGETVDVEYISARYSTKDDEKVLSQFADVFSCVCLYMALCLHDGRVEDNSPFRKFASAEVLTGAQSALAAAAEEAAAAPAAAAEDEDDEEHNNREKKSGELSKKKKRQLKRLSIAELKQAVERPDVVEAHDATAADSRLLVYLKSYRNAVPVPRHWCHKRKYLQGKRGVEKKPWQLPEFIAQTGIEKIRRAIIEKEADRKAKSAQRDRVAPKMGRMDVDYQVLHDAFFKWQTKPPLSTHGEIYYEGKEFEIHLKEKRPGQVSPALKAALGMPDGAPPPWLINMQRYGPPPSYPNLRIAGLNAPIPDGASFGYHPGGWGKPPVDEYGRPLYGDVFGGQQPAAGGLNIDPVVAADVVQQRWGELPDVDEESDEEEEDYDEDEDGAGPRRVSGRAPRGAGDASETDTSGLETPTDDGVSSVVSGLETPDAIDLRKRAGLDTPDTSGLTSAQSSATEKQLYQVIDEQRAKGAYVGSTLFASDKRYNLAGGGRGVEASLDPATLETDLASQKQLNDKYANDDDDDDGRNKRKRDGADAASNSTKKSKDFRF